MEAGVFEAIFVVQAGALEERGGGGVDADRDTGIGDRVVVGEGFGIEAEINARVLVAFKVVLEQ